MDREGISVEMAPLRIRLAERLRRRRRGQWLKRHPEVRQEVEHAYERELDQVVEGYGIPRFEYLVRRSRDEISGCILGRLRDLEARKGEDVAARYAEEIKAADGLDALIRISHRYARDYMPWYPIRDDPEYYVSLAAAERQ